MKPIYLHFGEAPELVSAMPHVRQGKDVIVTRTFSKIYGYQEFSAIYAAIAKSDYHRRRVERGAAHRSGRLYVVQAPADQRDAGVRGAHRNIETVRSLGRRLVPVKLRADYTADVRALASEADKAGGVIYRPSRATCGRRPRQPLFGRQSLFE